MTKKPTPVQGPATPASDDAKQEPEAAKPEAPKAEEKKDDKHDKSDKKHPLTWERTIEIFKVLATIWVAMVGTICTMQFNERQHELNSIEAIAKVLPHLSSAPSDKVGDGNEMSRDGAIWAAFRIANNKVMLRDLAALYPEDIYRVVSSIAAADGLEHDPDALTALEVSSEKLANKYANDETKQQLSVRLLDQSMRIREHLNGNNAPLNIVDLSTSNDFPASDEQTSDVMNALNRLGKMHLTNSLKGETIGTERSRGRQLFVRSRQLGISAKKKTPAVMHALIEADECLSQLLKSENKDADAAIYATEAKDLASNKAVDTLTQLQLRHMEHKFSEMDKDGDGKVSASEMKEALKEGVISRDEFKEWLQRTGPDGVTKPVAVIPIDKPTVVTGKN